LEKYPVLIELQDTEMRVFILGNQGIKPKDIALTLGISYAYVRNIRSKLKKMLGLASNHSLEGLL
jgi:DNA-binding CsgD family transcriptional regulator